MIVTPRTDRRNRRAAFVCAGVTAGGLAAAALVEPTTLVALPLVGLVYWLVRRKVLRRKRVERRAFPAEWERVLSSRVSLYNALDEAGRDRFRRMLQVFLSEVRVTGVRAEVDDVVTALVGASAVIPVFGFPDWEYTGLSEVLVYPSSFDDEYQTDGDRDARFGGMVGGGALKGLMLLSKSDLLAGFEEADDQLNVGVHEFVHLVDAQDGVLDGLPPGVPHELAMQWVSWVAGELEQGPGGSHVRAYAYTDELEYLATVAEYFFERPAQLHARDPVLYERLQRMFRQDTRSLLDVRRPFLRGSGRNAPCPCGSGKKFKRCCKRLIT